MVGIACEMASDILYLTRGVLEFKLDTTLTNNFAERENSA